MNVYPDHHDGIAASPAIATSTSTDETLALPRSGLRSSSREGLLRLHPAKPLEGDDPRHQLHRSTLDLIWAEARSSVRVKRDGEP